MAAALKGSEEIGFTSCRSPISLIAVLIPLLFMGDVVGRSVPRIRAHPGYHDSHLGRGLADADAMMCAGCCATRRRIKQGRFYHVFQRFFDRTIEGYGKTLRWVLSRQRTTLFVAAASWCSRAAVRHRAQGFFPVQEHRRHPRHFRSAAVGVVRGHGERPAGAGDGVLQDPAVESLSSFHRCRRTNTTLNSGRLLINLKPLPIGASARAKSSAACSRAGRDERHHALSCNRCRTSLRGSGPTLRSISTAWKMPTPTS